MSNLDTVSHCLV